ncbi:MAG: hypothetical protein EOP54_01230 [Sphingobacteriales bacterium]|nr:MAG: hypothetical protein EOP54_01230 [Sphingobacteriales bacterium]
MKKIAIIAGLSAFFFSCTKTNSNQYSHWNVNGEAYSSNEVALSETKGGSYLKEINGLFQLRFGLMQLPAHNMYVLKHPTNNPDYATLRFLHNNTTYTVANDSVLLIFNQVNDKAQFTLPPTWFISAAANDSVLIEGIFNAP